jgi:hypothetical protein
MAVADSVDVRLGDWPTISHHSGPIRINSVWAPLYWATRFAGDFQVFLDAELEIWYKQVCRALDSGLARVGSVRCFILGGIAPAEESNRNVSFLAQNSGFCVSINRRYRPFEGGIAES